MTTVKPIPDGFHTVTPAICVRGAREAIAFYERAFGAEQLRCFASKEGVVGHAEIRIGDSVVMISDELPQWGFHSPKHYGGSPSSMMIYGPDAKAMHARAITAGATEASPVQEMFGELHGAVVCPFGHRWVIATRVANVPDAEIQRATEALFEST